MKKGYQKQFRRRTKRRPGRNRAAAPEDAVQLTLDRSAVLREMQEGLHRLGVTPKGRTFKSRPISIGPAVFGKVYDAETNQALEGVRVEVAQRTATSAANGAFYVGDLRKGPQTLTAKKARYGIYTETIDVDADLKREEDRSDQAVASREVRRRPQRGAALGGFVRATAAAELPHPPKSRCSKSRPPRP